MMILHGKIGILGHAFHFQNVPFRSCYNIIDNINIIDNMSQVARSPIISDGLPGRLPPPLCHADRVLCLCPPQTLGLPSVAPCLGWGTSGGCSSEPQLLPGPAAAGAGETIFPGAGGEHQLPASLPQHQATPPHQPPHGCGHARLRQDCPRFLDEQHLLHKMDDTLEVGLGHRQRTSRPR